MIRRVTAFVVMLALIGLLAMLVWQVQEHHRRGYGEHETTIVANFARAAALDS